MTGTDLKKAVYNLTKDSQWADTNTSKDSLIVNWVQMAAEELPVEAISTNGYPLMGIVAGEQIELPVDFAAAESYEVYDESSEGMVSYEPDDLDFTGDMKIAFPIDIDTGTLYYHPIPTMESIDDDLPVNALFYTAMIYFMYAQYYYMQGEGDIEEHRMAETYMVRYERMKNQKINLLLNKTPDSKPVKVTDEMPTRLNGRIARSGYYE